MKQQSKYRQFPVAWLRRALPRTHSVFPGTCAGLLALGLLSASNASADVVAGWDEWSDTGGKTYDATTTTGATGQAVGTSTGGSGWNGWNSAANSYGASTDGTWGTLVTAPSPTTAATSTTAAVGLVNATVSGEMTFTVTNTSGGDLELTGFYFDGGETRSKAAGNWTLSTLAGSGVTVATGIDSGTLPINLGPTTGNFNTDLTAALADNVLADGESVIFQLAFTGGVGDAAGGHNAMIDNVAVTADFPNANKLVVLSPPASAVAGVDFTSFTVQVQDGLGVASPVAVDTEIELAASGLGTLSGNTATILAGQSSFTFDFVQYTKAESITLTASATSGDLLSTSVASSSINVLAAGATELVIETAADGSGVPVGPELLNPTESITVYAISRDAFGNFVANDADSWSLENITGSIVSGDLFDNSNESATFTADGVGTANIRATFTGLPDADSGLITVEEFVNRWTGAGANGSWQTDGNWTDSILPAFDSTTDLYFSAVSNSKGSPYIGQNISARSLTFDTTSTGTFNISLVKAGNALPADMTFDTDSLTEPAEINVDAAFTGTLTLGYTGTTEAGRGVFILEDDLLVTHDGSSNLVMNADITENGGSYGITKAGTGTLIISGTNTYTGDTTVEGGVLAVTGSSIADTNTLVIDGGIVEVTGNEVVAELLFGGNPQPLGDYSASSVPAGATITTASFTGAGTLTVQAAASGYSTWAAANVGGQLPGEDFNLDGVDNGIAYFMNDTGVISLPGIVGGEVTWMNGGNIPAGEYDNEFVVETSQNLVTWTPVLLGALTTNNDTTLTYTPPIGQGKWFVRLTVTPN